MTLHAGGYEIERQRNMATADEDAANVIIKLVGWNDEILYLWYIAG